jgi:beta-lactam-binding protein with PASTA domain
MKIFKFIASKTFWANVLVALVLGALVLWGVSAALDSYTLHRQNIQVPALGKYSITEAEAILAENNLKFEVIDSSEFDPSFPRGSVVSQYPDAGGFVKEDRVIKLTINPLQPRKIDVPNLIEKTRRRAIYDIESKGFVVGELSYVPYIGKDVVVDVKHQGKSVAMGTQFVKGTVIDLVLGQGLGSSRIRSPYLRWLTADEAETKLKSKSLNLGSVVWDEEITDSSLALVYRQYPNPSLEASINLGQAIDIWITNDYTKIPNDSLQYLSPEMADSLMPDSILDDLKP